MYALKDIDGSITVKLKGGKPRIELYSTYLDVFFNRASTLFVKDIDTFRGGVYGINSLIKASKIFSPLSSLKRTLVLTDTHP